MSWTLLETLLTNILRVPPTLGTLPFDIYTLVAYVLPACLSYYVVAVLVILPGTRTLRIALWPLIVSLAFRVTMFVDFSCGNPQRTHLNVGIAVCVSHSFLAPFTLAPILCSWLELIIYSVSLADLQLVMFCIVIRTLEWSFLKDPLQRPVRPAPSILIDALDLATNVRGVGWNWSKGLRFPRDTRPTSRLQFAIYALLSALFHNFICGLLHIAIQAFALEAFTTMSGSTIFDDTLPPLTRYARSSIISILTAFVVYTDVQTNYDIGTFIGVTVAQQDPAQWPPVFDEPWKATSLHDFWGYRWHQFVRRTFVVLGGRPLGFVFGRVGYVVGSFLASGIVHNVVVAMLNRSVEWWIMPLTFGMMAVGVVIEHVFTQMTGRRMGGWIGRVWTMAWLLMWGNLMVDGFARAGMFASSSVSGPAALAKGIVEHYVTALDRWLRACASAS